VLHGYSICALDPGCTGTSPAAYEKAHVLLSRVIIMLAFATPLVLFPQFTRVAPWSRVSFLSILLPVMGYLVFPGCCARP
jgi:hypothetical protein